MVYGAASEGSCGIAAQVLVAARSKSNMKTNHLVVGVAIVQAKKETKFQKTSAPLVPRTRGAEFL